MLDESSSSSIAKCIVGRKRCAIWLENDEQDVLNGPDGLFKVSVWVLATAWGQYKDVMTIELRVKTGDGDVEYDYVLPTVRIPLVVQAVTHPIEFPLAANVHIPTVK